VQLINDAEPPQTTADDTAKMSVPEVPETVQSINRAEELGAKNTPPPPGAEFPEITQFFMVGEDTQ
jgi:hypothetical protein